MFDEKEIAYLQEMKERITRSMAVLIESDVTPKFSLLADGIKDIQEKLVPRSRMDDLEDEVKFLKLMCRQMAEDICSATRFLRNRDRIVEKNSPILRSISEARSLASTAPQQGERPTQEGGLF